MLYIIPAILTNQIDELYKMLSQCEGSVDRVQIDILDNQFAKNETIDPLTLSDYDTKLFIDYHLMVKEPIFWVEQCIKAQADRIIAQIEMMEDQMEFVDKVTSFGKKVGLAIDIDTDVSQIDADVAENLDVVLVMSVKAGFGGQEFDDRAIEKIKNLVKIREEFGYAYLICVDGGISSQNIKSVYDAGADEVCVGRRLFDGTIRENIGKLMSELKTQNSKS